MTEQARYKLHRVLDLVIDESEKGNDTSINICCCADGAASIFTTICDGEFKKDVKMDSMSSYIGADGKISIQEMVDGMRHRMTKDGYVK